MNSSVLVLILTAILGLLGIGVIIAAVFFSQNKENNFNNNFPPISPTGSTGFTGCISAGVEPSVPAPSYVRLSPYSTCSNPLSTSSPSFPSINHTVERSYRLRSISNPISPNHWLGNAMYGSNNFFLFYPYYGQINDDSFKIAWPSSGVLSQNCGSGTGTTCPLGYADLSFDVSSGPSINITSSGSFPVACDIVNVDALVATVVWQYRNIATSTLGSISIPIAKGSPFVTIEVTNSTLVLDCNFNSSISPTEKSNIYTAAIDSDTGYLIFLDKPRTLSTLNQKLYFNVFTGTVRIAYYNSSEMSSILLANYNVYPIESTIDTVSTLNNNEWEVDTTFTWTTRTMTSDSIGQLLMAALPHHNVVNILYETSLFSHPILGRYRLITTTQNNNQWILAEGVPQYPLIYPSVSQYTSLFVQTWNNEIQNINATPPTEFSDWCRWIGSLGQMILIGDMLGQDISLSLQTLIQQLSLLSSNSTLVYDKTWGGVISKLGLKDCSGLSDDGNAFYDLHVNQYGYLVFAFAVAGQYNPTFLQNNMEMALYFVRDYANPCFNDTSFPLWRHKDWYFGYSLSSGLSQNQSRGKNTSDIGEAVLGYYGSYILGTLLSNTDLTNWSIGMLSSEILSLQYYFIFYSYNSIEVDYNFVQGTITNRGDSYYAYTTLSTTSSFPERNATIMVPVLKPLNLVSMDYLNPNWTNYVYQWIVPALQNGITSLDPESLATALALLGVKNETPYTTDYIVRTIAAQSGIYLPYGTTWSSVMYWVLSQS